MFCGDGINDIAALSAADVGLAVGATDAVIAATLSTSRGSVAGKSQFLPFHNPDLWPCTCTYTVSAIRYASTIQCYR